MSVGVQNLSRRTRTLRPEQKTSDSGDSSQVTDVEKFIDFKPVVFAKPVGQVLSGASVDRLETIAKKKKYNNYSVTRIKELPLSSGLTEDESESDANNNDKGGLSDGERCNGEPTLYSQLGTKERELQVAIQRQERYQSTVQDVTARMERVQQKLATLGTSPFKNLDKQMADQKVSGKLS